MLHLLPPLQAQQLQIFEHPVKQLKIFMKVKHGINTRIALELGALFLWRKTSELRDTPRGGMPGLRLEPMPLWWEASALTTTPLLLPPPPPKKKWHFFKQPNSPAQVNRISCKLPHPYTSKVKIQSHFVTLGKCVWQPHQWCTHDYFV